MRLQLPGHLSRLPRRKVEFGCEPAVHQLQVSSRETKLIEIKGELVGEGREKLQLLFNMKPCVIGGPHDAPLLVPILQQQANYLAIQRRRLVRNDSVAVAE